MPRAKKLSIRQILLLILYIPAFGAGLVFLGINLYFHFHGQGGYTQEPGGQFAGFKDVLKNEHKVNYITNRDITPEKNDGQFLMSQYQLAPTVIELNSKDNRFSIIDTNDPQFALNTLKSTNSIPIIVNEYGKVLAVKK
ncbi:MAG: hypothetical protein HQL23_09245 [Candidatus Omnitrophica bacterium]|nr:hypothetical protein [Candidatus Omnitrophota bacterium]